MECTCNYRCASTTSGSMQMADMARANKLNEVIHNLNTRGVRFAIRRKEPEAPKKETQQIKFI
jgi:hypothetical protein